MTVLETAQRVLAWACEPQGAPPTGSVDGIDELVGRNPDTEQLLGRLTGQTAAMLGAGAQPFGDTGPVGPGAVLLAAAIGARLQPAVAERFALSVPASERHALADAVARHGVISHLTILGDTTRPKSEQPGQSAKDKRRAGPDGVSERLLDTMLQASPLTSVIYRPARQRLSSGATAAETDLALELPSRPHGRACLAAALGRPTGDRAVLAWRTRLLTRLRYEHADVVVDAYLAARLRYPQDWDALLTKAAEDLSGPGLPAEESLAVLRFWAPLAALGRSDPAVIPHHPFLDGYQRAFQLLDRYRVGEAG